MSSRLYKGNIHIKITDYIWLILTDHADYDYTILTFHDNVYVLVLIISKDVCHTLSVMYICCLLLSENCIAYSSGCMIPHLEKRVADIDLNIHCTPTKDHNKDIYFS